MKIYMEKQIYEDREEQNKLLRLIEKKNNER